MRYFLLIIIVFIVGCELKNDQDCTEFYNCEACNKCDGIKIVRAYGTKRCGYDDEYVRGIEHELWWLKHDIEKYGKSVFDMTEGDWDSHEDRSFGEIDKIISELDDK